MSNREAIELCLNTIREGLIADQQRKNMRATGHSAATLGVIAQPDYGALFGASYFKYQKTGRGPGGMPPIEKIKQWLEARHLDLSPWAVAKKIQKEGSGIFRGERQGLNIEEIVKQAKANLVLNLLRGTRVEIQDKIRNAIKK